MRGRPRRFCEAFDAPRAAALARLAAGSEEEAWGEALVLASGLLEVAAAAPDGAVRLREWLRQERRMGNVPESAAAYVAAATDFLQADWEALGPPPAAGR